MTQVDIRLRAADIDQLDHCQQELNDWANSLAADGYTLQNVTAHPFRDQLVIIAVAVAPGPPPPTAPPAREQAPNGKPSAVRTTQLPEYSLPQQESGAGHTAADDEAGDDAPEHPQASEPGEADDVQDAPEQDQFDVLFPPSAERTAPQASMLSLFPEDPNFTRDPAAQPRSQARPGPEDDAGTDTGWAQKGNTGVWWRRYGPNGTAQVGKSNMPGKPYWWRIIGPGGRHLAKGECNTAPEGRAACDSFMAAPADA